MKKGCSAFGLFALLHAVTRSQCRRLAAGNRTPGKLNE